MINIIRDKKLINNDKVNFTILGDADVFVVMYSNNLEANILDDLSLHVVKEIDSCIPKSDSSIFYNIKHKSDVRVTDLSTGCKTVLMYLHYMKNKEMFSRNKKVVIDVSECGVNALEVLFECAEKLNDCETYFLLSHSNYIYKLSDRDYLVDFKDHITKSMYL